MSRTKTPLTESSEKFYMEIGSRISRSPNTCFSNCLGSALYFVGEIEDERPIGTKTKPSSFDLFSGLVESLNAQKGVIVVWKKGDHYQHAGVVTSTNPFLITHREGHQSGLCVNVPFKEVDKRYRVGNIRTTFLVPKKLETSL